MTWSRVMLILAAWAVTGVVSGFVVAAWLVRVLDHADRGQA